MGKCQEENKTIMDKAAGYNFWNGDLSGQPELMIWGLHV